MLKTTLLSCLLLGSALSVRGSYGFDVVLPPERYAAELRDTGLTGEQGRWMRIRGVVDHHRVKEGGERTVERDRAGLAALRARGIKPMVYLRWEYTSWTGGARPGGGHRMPLDLREAYERARWLGATYGDLVDGWEIDNEPDIGFGPDNPETYAAFLKAVYLGLRAGAGAPRARPVGGDGKPEGGNLKPEGEALRTEGSDWRERKTGVHSSYSLSPSLGAERADPLVIMAALALPPGPYLERLLANGLLSYTDGFNFHYYGYAEDFTGVYRQFEDAVGTAATPTASRFRSHVPGPHPQVSGLRPQISKRLPIFITEYGYGLLDAESRNSVDGRVRQWRWFRDVIGQVRALRPEGPMAFLWNPYYEAGMNEFGLTMVTAAKLRSESDGESDGGRKRRDRNVPAPENGRELEPGSPDPGTGGLVFTPGDFGEGRERAWMRRIGARMGEWHASPALAYLWDFAERNRYRPRDWRVRVEAASPVVVDFVPVADMVQSKSLGGYILTGRRVAAAPEPERGGAGRVVLYNFSNTAAGGLLRVATDGAGVSWREMSVTLAPNERRELDVAWSVPAERAVAGRVRVEFVPDAKNAARAVWSARVLPTTEGMRETRVEKLVPSERESESARRLLEQRTVAEGEPRLRRDGRWLVTQGVRVEEIGGNWRFYIDHMPVEPLHSAIAELPLPPGFSPRLGEASLAFEIRRVQAEPAGSRTVDVSPAQLRSRAGVAGDMMAVYLRGENGNLFTSWPRRRVLKEWVSFEERTENFTMGFFGRAELPWRLSENRVASVVFYFRPSEVPSIVEVRDARVFEYRREAPPSRAD